METRRVLFVALLALALIPAGAGALLAQSEQKTPPATQEPIEDRTPQDAIVPFVGFNFGGGLFSNVNVLGDLKAKPRALGVSMLFWGPGILAGELDFGYNPNFYSDLNAVVAPGANTNMLTLTANFVIGPTIFIGENMRVRPYGLVGGGLMRSKIDEFIQHLSFKDKQNMGVVDFAGGVYFYPIKRIGIRTDLRYFKGVGANKNKAEGWGYLDNWTYLRLTFGAAVAF
jgi:hypothetical protein